MTEIKEEEMDDDVSEPQNSTKISTKISTGVLQMNFMKRSYNLVETQRKRHEAKRRKKNEIKVFPTVLKYDDDPVEGLDGVVREDRFTRLEDLRFGRFSFGGKNPEVEKLMEFHERRRKNIEEGELDSDEEISPQTMAQTMNSYRQPQFKRPRYDDVEVKQEPNIDADIIIENVKPGKKRKLKVQGQKFF